MIDISVADKKQMPAIVKILQSALVHDPFFKAQRDAVTLYLSNLDATIYVASDDQGIAGAIVVTAETHGDHMLWRIKHIAIAENRRGEGIGVIMSDHVDTLIREKLDSKQFSSAKIELTVQEDQKVFANKDEHNDVAFWQRSDYVVEGELHDHFKRGGITYILGKTLRQ